MSSTSIEQLYRLLEVTNSYDAVNKVSEILDEIEKLRLVVKAEKTGLEKMNEMIKVLNDCGVLELYGTVMGLACMAQNGRGDKPKKGNFRRRRS
jgi:hypothetical protein